MLGLHSHILPQKRADEADATEPPSEEADQTMSRVLVFLLLPAICFLWFVGWSLVWIGVQHE